ncbi:hypothetical protein J2Z48_000778 [Croceifilum oryzae]|uniref:HTTM-like domain-containing protein n=2 Tax=Croceifilum oryzae TaxID=1553429 RepID=A0AAJ1TKZ0_9BACL|nr:HTTM domain-containing protein [Croceifilum oryzae]MDQ0416611.1 hypothetical protein [Croceifilum oryzae]
MTLEGSSTLRQRFHQLFYNEKFLIGASLARISFGFIMLYYYLIHYTQRYFIWSYEGIINEHLSDKESFSLYNFSTSSMYFDIVYHVSILIAILYLCGYKTRITSILFFITTYSILQRNFLVADGGDNLVINILFFLMFANTYAYFSFDSAKWRARSDRRNNLFHLVLALVHNMAIIACVVQLCILYLTAGFYQVMGESWNSGVAIYYIFQVDEYANPFIRDLVINHDILIFLGNYFSIIIKIAFPFLLFNRYTKYLAVVGIAFFHIGIAIGMGLVTFSLIMLTSDLLIIGDQDFRWMKSKWLQLIGFMRNKIRRLPSSTNS